MLGKLGIGDRGANSLMFMQYEQLLRSYSLIAHARMNTLKVLEILKKYK